MGEMDRLVSDRKNGDTTKRSTQRQSPVNMLMNSENRKSAIMHK